MKKVSPNKESKLKEPNETVPQQNDQANDAESPDSKGSQMTKKSSVGSKVAEATKKVHYVDVFILVFPTLVRRLTCVAML